MARRNAISYTVIRAQQTANRAQRERERAERAFQRAQRAAEKERARRYFGSQITDAAERTAEVGQEVAQLQGLLADALRAPHSIDLETLKETPKLPPFDPGGLDVAELPPMIEPYLPAPMSWLGQFFKRTRHRHAEQTAKARDRYNADLEVHRQREAARLAELAEAQRKHEKMITKATAATAAQHAQVDQLRDDLTRGLREAVVQYFELVLDRSAYPDGFPQTAKLAYVPESKQLVVEYDLPPFEIVPEATGFKYVKAKDAIVPTARPVTHRRQLYSSVVAQTALRTLHELFDADHSGVLDSIVFNGHVDTIDKGTGHPVRPCLVTVRTTRDTFTALSLQNVDPIACLKTLNASVSKSPAELAPVRPVLEFNMVDPRFIEESDVLSGLDQRSNLMELSPAEFESLITNLFEKMGLETRLTQASRDGGVDCVAYDTRPIFGGKVVIQAKRYRHTVGVSAVRDLFGTVQNEGASKGILVTTSGYGKASFEFADGKPLELLSGSHLLHLLAEHTGIEAKIEVPDDWKDPVPDMGTDE